MYWLIGLLAGKPAAVPAARKSDPSIRMRHVFRDTNPERCTEGRSAKTGFRVGQASRLSPVFQRSWLARAGFARASGSSQHEKRWRSQNRAVPTSGEDATGNSGTGGTPVLLSKPDTSSAVHREHHAVDES